MIGLLILWLGISWSMAVVSIGPILGAILVMLYAPGTRGRAVGEVRREGGVHRAGGGPGRRLRLFRGRRGSPPADALRLV